MVLRWGIVSAGKISHDFVCAVQTHSAEHHQVLAVAARSLEDAGNFAKKLDIPKSYEGYEALAQDNDIDIVYIGCLNNNHLEVSKLMLDHGKHVLCEKPLTMNAKQSRELIQYAQDKKLFLMEAVWSRCFPVYIELAKQIEDGKIGHVEQVRVDFGFPLQSVNRVQVKDMGGSATLDIGVYVLQFSQYVYRNEKPVNVVSAGNLNEYNTDDSAGIVLIYPEGKTSVVSYNTKAALDNTAYVYGTKGTIQIPNFWCPTTIITPTGTRTFDLPKTSAKFNYLNSVGLAYEAEEARQCIAKGLLESPRITHAESLELAELMDKVRKSVGNVFVQDDE